MHTTNNTEAALNAWLTAQAIVPYAVIAIALFTFIMMLALISNTNAIEKRIYWIQEHLEEEARKRANSDATNNQGGSDRT